MNTAPQKQSSEHRRKGRPRANLDMSKVLNLYIEKRLTVRQVASQMGVSHTTVARRIADELGQLRAWRMPGER